MSGANAPAQAAMRPLDPASPAQGALQRAIQRLEEVIEQETAALRTRAPIDLKDFNNRKSQGLLDLNKALRPFATAGMDTTVIGKLSGLRAKLDVNRAVLKMHLEAVREISTIVADTIRDADSDGTYSPSISSGYGP